MAENIQLCTDFGRYLNRQTTEEESRRKLCDCLKKCKIIIIATIVSILLVTVIVGIVLGLILPALSGTSDTSGNEPNTTTAGPGTSGTSTSDTSEYDSKETTAGPAAELTTIDAGSRPKGQGLLVIIGGFMYNVTVTYYDTVQIYTVDKGHVTWNKYGTPAPFHWHNAGTASSGSNIYIAGGRAWDSDGRRVVLWNRRAAKYNVKDDEWEILPHKTIHASYRPGMYVINNHLYAADGDGTFSSSNPSPPTEKYISNVESGWTREQAEPTYDVLFTQAVVIGNTVYICAGRALSTITVISWTYGEPAWTPVANMNVARWRHGTVTDGISNIWVVGGCDPDDCWPDGFIEHYNVADNTWTKLNHVPDIDRDHYILQVCSFWQGYIYVIFSSIKAGVIPRFHVYNTQTGEWHEESTELMIPVYESMSAIVPETS